MSETLYIRLGSRSTDRIHWLVYSSAEQEIIASGELQDKTALSQLTEKAQARNVVAFVPCSDVSMKSLVVPGKSQRAIRLAAPYMLEDDLAQDVEQMFFAYANLPTDAQGRNCFVAAVNIEQMQRWQSWLSDAGISAKKMIPDALALPQSGEASTAIMLGDQVLVKQSAWQCGNYDSAAWSIIVNHWANSEQPQAINHYSSLPEVEIANEQEALELHAQPEELPLALMAQHVKNVDFNLLQGQFKFSEKRSPVLQNWLLVAGFAAVALVLNLGMKTAKLYELNTQQAAVEEQIIASYKTAFPNSKRVRVTTVKSVLKQKLNELGQNAENDGFLTMLAKLRPAFMEVPQMRPQTLKFEAKRSEVRIQASAKDYQSFEQFKTALEKENLTVAQGSQTNQGDSVSGSFSIKG